MRKPKRERSGFAGRCESCGKRARHTTVRADGTHSAIRSHGRVCGGRIASAAPKTPEEPLPAQTHASPCSWGTDLIRRATLEASP